VFQSLIAQSIALLVLLVASWMVYFFFLKPIELKLENKLSRYPTQWSHLSHINKSILQNRIENSYTPFFE
jgi:hypothetical protein